MCGTPVQSLPLIQPASGCACCSPQESSTEKSATPAGAGGPAAQFQVAGMTCGHCVSGVTAELGKLDGVSEVQVSLVPGGASTVTVYGTGAISPDAMRDAVAAAGYKLAGTA